MDGCQKGNVMAKIGKPRFICGLVYLYKSLKHLRFRLNTFFLNYVFLWVDGIFIYLFIYISLCNTNMLATNKIMDSR